MISKHVATWYINDTRQPSKSFVYSKNNRGPNKHLMLLISLKPEWPAGLTLLWVNYHCQLMKGVLVSCAGFHEFSY